MSKNYVTKLEKNSFTLDDGRIFDFPFEIDELPSLEDFNKLYEEWEEIVSDESKLTELLNGD